MKKFFAITTALAGTMMSSVSAATQELPQGRAFKLMDVESIIRLLTNSLVYISGFVMVIFIILSGIKYMTAQGDSKKVDEAKAMFNSGIVGALIVLGVGVILATLRVVVTGEFFGLFPGI